MPLQEIAVDKSRILSSWSAPGQSKSIINQEQLFNTLQPYKYHEMALNVCGCWCSPDCE